MDRTPVRNLAGVALVAASALLLEVNLTRIFAVTLWYYFGFVAISLALLGTAIAAICCFLAPVRFFGEQQPRYLASFALLFALLAPLSTYIHLRLGLTHYADDTLKFLLMLTVQLCPLVLAFFSAGMCISMALFGSPKDVSRVYFFDLLGAAVGSVLVVPLLYHWSAPAIMFAVSFGAALAAYFFARHAESRLLRPLSLGVTALSALLFIANDQWEVLSVAAVKSYSPQALQQPEQGRVFEKWSPVSRVAVFAPVTKGAREYMEVTNDAGAPTRLNRFNGDFSTMPHVRLDSREIVHHLRPNAEVLIIGSGGGMDVLSALSFNQQKITAVEINPVIAELVTRYYADYIGRIFQDPRVTLHVQEGRNFAAGSAEQYDIVQITMIDSWAGAAAGAYLFNENSLYTVEAVRDYMRHLKPDGILSITRYSRWHEALRLMNVMIEQQLQGGHSDLAERMIVVREPTRGYRRATVLLKNGKFTPAESQRVFDTAVAGRYEVIYAPYLAPEQLSRSDFGRVARGLLEVSARGSAARAAFVASYPANIAPSTDNWPFFFFTTRFSDLLRAEVGDHPARRLAMPFLYGTFIVFFVICVLAVFLPLWLSRRVDIRQAPRRLACLSYFACLGMGFMLIELSLIQRLTVFLGHPTYSFVVILATLLAASGIGSYVGGRWNPEGEERKLLLVLAGIVVLTIIQIVFVYDRFIDWMVFGKSARVALTILTVTPLGFLLGMCFPMGMQIVRRFHEHLPVWGWGVNGATSVFASILSLVIALNLGLKAAMTAGLLFYCAAIFIVLSLSTARKTA